MSSISLTMRELLEALPPACLLDGRGGILFCNGAYRGVFGDCLPAEVVSGLFSLEEGARKNFSVEFSARPAGTPFRADLFSLPGGKRLFLLLCRNTSREQMLAGNARKERQRLEGILQAVSDWVFETDADGRLTFVSDRITATLGYPVSLVRGMSIGELAGGGDVSGILAEMSARRHFRGMPAELVSRDGERRWFLVSGEPFFDDGGAGFLGYRGAGTDVTGQQKAEAMAGRYRAELAKVVDELHERNRELRKSLETAEEGARAKQDFLATMSHELRTPLNAIIGFSELMKREALGPLAQPYREYAGDICAAGGHLLALIEDVLQLARLDRNEPVPLVLASVEIGRLVAAALKMTEISATRKGVEVRNEGGAQDVLVRMDREKAVQILINLVGNAIKFTQGGGLVRVSWETGRRQGLVAVSVRDNGPGIAAGKREGVFESFVQVHDGVLSRKEEGLGIGLAVARRLSWMMGGDVTLEPSEEGCHFIAWFRLARPDGQAGSPA